jgi:hypothetical protein
MTNLRNVLLALAMFTLLAGSASAAGYSNVRDGWMYGLNLGWGWTRVEADDTTNGSNPKSDWEDDLAGGLRVAFCPSETFAYGLDFSGWADYAGAFDTKAFWILAQAHWFPGGQGFFLRGGAGLGSMSVSYLPVGYPRITESAGGLAWGGGVGWEARVSPSFAMGIAWDYRWTNVGEMAAILDNVTAENQMFTFSFTWYPE